MSTGETWVKTLTVPPNDVLKILILEKRENLVESIESYHRVDGSGSTADIYEVKARLISLWLELQSAYKNDKGQEKHDLKEAEIKAAVSIDALVECFKWLSEWLYDKRLTKFDSKEHYDRSRVVSSNKRLGR